MFVAAGAGGTVAVAAAGASVAGTVTLGAAPVAGEALAVVAGVPSAVGVSVFESLLPPHATSAIAATPVAADTAMLLNLNPKMLGPSR